MMLGRHFPEQALSPVEDDSRVPLGVPGSEYDAVSRLHQPGAQGATKVARAQHGDRLAAKADLVKLAAKLKREIIIVDIQ